MNAPGGGAHPFFLREPLSEPTDAANGEFLRREAAVPTFGADEEPASEEGPASGIARGRAERLKGRGTPMQNRRPLQLRFAC